MQGRGELRREPTTAAGRQIVDAILVAAGEQLAEFGYPGLNTNAIAERAGVGIASLYRYFTDKHAVVAVLATRQRARFQARVEAGPPERCAEAVVARWVDATLELAASDPTLFRALFSEVPPVRMLADPEADSMGVRALASQLAGASGARCDDAAVFVAFHALRGVVRGILCEQPAWLREAETRAELVRLLTHYLCEVPVEVAPAAPPQLTLPSAPGLRAPMPRAPVTTKRRRATVDRLMAAAERVLQREPRAKPGVRAIAAEAGLSPGSFYRYFRDVDDLLVELVSRREARAVALVEEVLAAASEASLETVIRDLLTVLTSPRHGHMGVRYAQAAHLPRSAYRPATRHLETALEARVATELHRRPAEARRGDSGRMAFISVRAVQWTLEADVLRHDVLRADLLTRELSALVHRYLRVRDAQRRR